MAHLSLVFILTCLVVAVIGGKRRDSDDEKQWKRVPGYAVQISAKGSELWAVNRYKQVIRLEGKNWAVFHHNGVHVAASTDGGAWMVRDDIENINVMRFNRERKVFEQVNGFLQNINARSGTDAIGVGREGCLHRNTGDWIHLNAHGCNNMQVAMGDADALWRLDLASDLYRFDGGSFSKVPTPVLAKNFDVQSNKRVVFTDEDDTVWLFDGSDWTNIKINGRPCVQATVNYKSVYCLDNTGAIWEIED